MLSHFRLRNRCTLRRSHNVTKRLPAPAAHRQAIRGVFAGGTFCYEANLSANKRDSAQLPIRQLRVMCSGKYLAKRRSHVDRYGRRYFTRGKPHPMIDPTLRNQRLSTNSTTHTLPSCYSTWYLVMRFHDACQRITGPTFTHRHEYAPLLIAHVCGTEADPQIRSSR